jgi:hypothetical protein
MPSVDLTTRDCDGHVIVMLRALSLTRLFDVFPVHASVDKAARRTAAARAGRLALAVAVAT